MPPADLNFATPSSPRTAARSDADGRLAALQRALFRRQKQRIDALVEGPSPSFKAYEARYRRGVRTFERAVPMAALHRAIRAADIVHVGDYHTLARAQRGFLELAEAALEPGRPVVLALEFVQGRHQQALDQHLAGGLTEPAFLKAIGYARHQVFDVWPNFRPLLELARERRLKVLAIDRTAAGPGSLATRDAYAAARIAEVAAGPDRPRVLVLTGQFHIAPAHLPAAVDLALQQRGAAGLRQLVVHQNCEDIYWRLLREGRARRTGAVRVREGEYCLIHTSPVVCQQSFLDFLHDGAAPLPAAGNASESFARMAQALAELVGARIRTRLAQVRVHAFDDLSFLDRLRAEGCDARELSEVRRKVLAGESCFLPRARLVYLASLTGGHGAREAARFVRQACTGEATLRRRDGRGAFYARAYEEALARFGSRLVHPRRGSAREPELSQLLASDDGTEQAGAALTLLHLRTERGENVRFPVALYEAPGSPLFDKVTQLLGAELGDRLHAAFTRGVLGADQARLLFHQRLEGQGAAEAAYRRMRELVRPTRR